eukprot:gb/GECH01001219.1/.p1 GENE.gb/GECH01001219.1/~~gb/GECH01001219.1/.p1  ORF type:complete len:326 (+),score=80.14 gb/GECH01001219.1/:1-978(+)
MSKSQQAQSVSLDQLNKHKGTVLKSHKVEKEDDISYDLGNLVAFDNHPIDLEKYKQQGEDYLQQEARDNVQLVVNQLFRLPTQSADMGRIARLPFPQTKLPREKKLPEDKPLTKWEKYRQRNRIKKNKDRNKKVFDETTQTWKRAHGWSRDKDNSLSDWIVPAKPGDEQVEDPFLARQTEKRRRKQNESQKQEKNLKRAQKEEGLPSTFDMTNTKKRLDKSGVVDAYATINRSTASLGKFDKKIKGAPQQFKDHKPSKYAPNDDPMEKEKTLKIAQKIAGNHKKELVNNATGLHQRKKEKQQSQKRKAHLVEFGSGRGSKKRRRE